MVLFPTDSGYTDSGFKPCLRQGGCIPLRRNWLTTFL